MENRNFIGEESFVKILEVLNYSALILASDGSIIEILFNSKKKIISNHFNSDENVYFQDNFDDEQKKKFLTRLNLVYKTGTSERFNVKVTKHNTSINLTIDLISYQEKFVICLIEEGVKESSYNDKLQNNIALIGNATEAIPRPIFIQNMDGEIVNFNEAFSDNFLSEKSGVFGEKTKDVLSANLAQTLTDSDNDLLTNGGVQSFEYYFKDKNKYYLIDRSIIYDFDDTPFGLISIFTDITDLKYSEYVHQVQKEFTNQISKSFTLSTAFESFLSNVIKLQSINSCLVCTYNRITNDLKLNGFKNLLEEEAAELTRIAGNFRKSENYTDSKFKSMSYSELQDVNTFEKYLGKFSSLLYSSSVINSKESLVVFLLSSTVKVIPEDDKLYFETLKNILIQHVVRILDFKRKEQFGILQGIISQAVPRFLESKKLDETITYLLKELGYFLKAKRSSLFLQKKTGVFYLSHEWLRVKTISYKDSLQNIKTDDYPWFFKEMQALKEIVIPETSRLPKSAINEKDFFLSLGVKSMIAFQVGNASSVLGFISFENLDVESEIVRDSVAYIRITTEIIGNALERARIEADLIQSRKELSDLNKNLEKQVEVKTAENMSLQKNAIIGDMIAGFIHNLRSPLSIITLQSQFLQYSAKSGRENKESFQKTTIEKAGVIITAAERIEKMLQNLMAKSQNDNSEGKQLININDFLKRELEFLNSNMDFKHKVTKKTSLSNKVPLIAASSADLSQVLYNLINNSMDALWEQKEKVIEFSTYYKNDRVFLEVQDNGPGIDKEHLNKLFDPFFSTKPPVGSVTDNRPTGTGLGLHSVKQLLSANNGNIIFESEPGVFTKALISFMPATADEIRSLQ